MNHANHLSRLTCNKVMLNGARLTKMSYTVQFWCTITSCMHVVIQYQHMSKEGFFQNISLVQNCSTFSYFGTFFMTKVGVKEKSNFDLKKKHYCLCLPGRNFSLPLPKREKYFHFCPRSHY